MQLQAILVFPHQTIWQYSDGNHPITGPSNTHGIDRNRDSEPILKMVSWYHLTLIASSKRRSLLIEGDDDEMFMTRSLNVMPKTKEQHLIARSDKSVAYVTNNKRLWSTFCTLEANCWQTWSIARPLCDSRATCYRRVAQRLLVFKTNFHTHDTLSRRLLTLALQIPACKNPM